MTNVIARNTQATIATGTTAAQPVSLGTFSGNLVPSLLAIKCSVAGGINTLGLSVFRVGADTPDAGTATNAIAEFAVAAGDTLIELPEDVLKQLNEYILEGDRVQYGEEVELKLTVGANATADIDVTASLQFIDRV